MPTHCAHMHDKPICPAISACAHTRKSHALINHISCVIDPLQRRHPHRTVRDDAMRNILSTPGLFNIRYITRSLFTAVAAIIQINRKHTHTHILLRARFAKVCIIAPIN